MKILPFLLGALAFAQTPPPPPSGYILGPDDQILIRALEGLDLADKPILIGTNGNITLPLIGRVNAAGLTVEQQVDVAVGSDEDGLVGTNGNITLPLIGRVMLP